MAVEMVMADEERGGGGGGASESNPALTSHAQERPSDSEVEGCRRAHAGRRVWWSSSERERRWRGHQLEHAAEPAELKP